VKLAELLAGLPIARSTPEPGASEAAADPTLPGGGNPAITGVTHDSRQVAPGDLFVGWRGERHDGADHARAAVAAGAAAVLVTTGSRRPEEIEVPWLTADDPHALLAPLAARAYGHPERELLLAGVTGTNGKSTVTTLLTRLLDTAGRTCGLFGSLGYFLGEHRYLKGRTTPEGSDFFRLLRRMRRDGADAVAMEVSSHALSLGRIEGVEFEVAAFTNLSRDHFDFYEGFEDYFQAKRRLFHMLEDGARASINAEDPYGVRLIEELGDRAVTWGERQGDVRPAEVELDERGIRGTFATPRGELAFESPLLGHFNLLNLLAAVAAAEALDLDHGAVAEGIARQKPLLGRMEPVDRGQPFPVYVDYSHTDQALEAALRSLRELSDKRIVVVFGCGGDKDPGKRPLMGRVAGELADVPIVTSDNPRTEDPLKIIAAVEEGIRLSGNAAYRVIPDRREAIAAAVGMADEGTMVLVAGKGDEPIQVIGRTELPFYDFDEVVKALEARFDAAAD